MATYITKRAKELGIKQVDAERPMIIEVHPGDVSKSVQKDPKRCAFSRACRRADKRIKEAFFFRTTAWLEYKDKMVHSRSKKRPGRHPPAKALREEARWSATIHANDKTGQAASDQRTLNRLADEVELVGKRLGFI